MVLFMTRCLILAVLRTRNMLVFVLVKRKCVHHNPFSVFMKIHLPKGLRLALLGAIMSYTVAYGADSPMLDVIDEIISVEAGTTQNFTPRTDTTGYSYSIAKDGDGTLLFTGAGTNNATLYVREGLMQVGDGMTETSLTIRPGSYQAEGRYTGMGVSGKNAEVCFDKASAASNETAFLWVVLTAMARW